MKNLSHVDMDAIVKDWQEQISPSAPEDQKLPEKPVLLQKPLRKVPSSQ